MPIKRDVCAVLKTRRILNSEVVLRPKPVEIANGKYYESNDTGCWYPCFRPGDKVKKRGRCWVKSATHGIRFFPAIPPNLTAGVVLYQTLFTVYLKNKARWWPSAN